MADLALTLQISAINPNIGDLALDDATGTTFLLSDDTSYPLGHAVMQDVFIRLRTFYGEWFLDPTQGVPYFKWIFVNNPNIKLIESIFRNVIINTPGIATVDSLSLTFDRPHRNITLAFTGKLESGHTFTSADFGAFLVSL